MFGMMLAESLTKFTKNTNLNIGFGGSGVLVDGTTGAGTTPAK